MGQLTDAAEQALVAPAHRGSPSIVLVCTDDVARSVGRPGFLEGRLMAQDSGTPALSVVREPGGSPALVLQRISGATVPDDVAAPEGLEAWLADAFTSHLSDPDVALAVLSVSSDWVGSTWRHRRHGFLVAPPTGFRSDWTPAQREWLERDFAEMPLRTPDDIAADLRTLHDHLRSHDAGLLVFNVSTFTPEEKVYHLASFDGDPLALRANRIDLMLDELAAELGFAIVDADRIVAELGAGEHVTAAAVYTDAAHAALAEEAASALVELPALSPYFGTDVMRVTVPRYDKRTLAGEIVKWHRTAPSTVERGDPLFDVRFSNLTHALDAKHHTGGKQRTLLVSVLAATDGHLQRIVRSEGAAVEVGATVAVMATSPEATVPDLEQTASFPVGVKVATR